MSLKIDYTGGDPEPSDIAAREAYVSQVSVFFQNIGTNKINFMINDLLKELINPDLHEEENKKIKLTINALSLFLDWGESMIKEHQAPTFEKKSDEEDVFNSNK